MDTTKHTYTNGSRKTSPSWS